MDQSVRDMHRNMRTTGMLLFRDAFMEAATSKSNMCVVHAAQAAEILLKARIAQKEPLSIFTPLPKKHTKEGVTPSLIQLIKDRHTIQYSKLPQQLKKICDIEIEDSKQQYQKFGEIRNQIIHLSITSEKKLDDLTLDYLLNFLDPLVVKFWGYSVFDFIKRDYFYRANHDYNFFLDHGGLEERINEIMPIDARLRKYLGEGRKKHLEYLAELDAMPLPPENYVPYEGYEDYDHNIVLNLNSEDNPDFEIYLEHEEEQFSEEQVIEDWKKFLKSFWEI